MSLRITLPPNTALYVTAITFPDSFYIIEVGRDGQIYFPLNGSTYSASIPTLPERNCTSTTFCAAMCDEMNACSRIEPHVGICLQRFNPHANMVNNRIFIISSATKFDRSTHEQALVEIYEGRLIGAWPLCFVSDMLRPQCLSALKLRTGCNQAMLICFQFVICVTYPTRLALTAELS